MTPTVAILASGSGTTAEAFIREAVSGQISCQVGLVIVSRQDAGIFNRLKRLNSELGISIEAKLINHKTHPALDGEDLQAGRQTLAEQDAMITQLENYDVIALMGYMKQIGPKLIEAFGWLPRHTSIYQARMVNTHPGILPDTKAMYGLNIQKYVLEHKQPFAGHTLHLVSKKYDDGPIIAEHKLKVKSSDTPESLFDRVQSSEKHHLPQDIETFVLGRRAYTRAQAIGEIGG